MSYELATRYEPRAKTTTSYEQHDMQSTGRLAIN
jgi:hypothetical protein